VARAKRAEQEAVDVMERSQVQDLNDPEIAAYIRSLKKKYQKYAMSPDEARAVVDRAMGEKTLNALLYEARE